MFCHLVLEGVAESLLLGVGVAESLDLGVGVAESLDLEGEGLALKELLLLRDCLLPPLGGVSPLRRLLALSFFSSLAACIEQSLLTA